MKTPRVTDFDPNAPEAPEAAATHTQPLGSPLDGMPAIVRPAPAASGPVRTSTPSADGSTFVPPVRGVPPAASAYALADAAQNRGAGIGGGAGAGADVVLRRAIKQRHPFDIYADQLDSLRHLAFEERIQGGLGSMSAMVREALDAYIAAKTRASVGATVGRGRAAEEQGERPHRVAVAGNPSRAEDASEDPV